MPEFDSDSLKALWEAGVPLNDAWIEFAVFFDRFALQALRTYPANDPDVLGTDHPRYKEPSKGWLPPTWEGRQKKLAITTKNERFHLLGEIYSGRLWAIGFRTLSSGFDEPVRVPRRLFFAKDGIDQTMHPDIDWDIEELKDGDNCYFDVRVVRPQIGATDLTNAVRSEDAGATPLPIQQTSYARDTPEIQMAAESPTTPEAQAARASVRNSTTAPKPGRPNRRDEIRGKVEELWNTDSRFREIPHRIDQAREVRAHLNGESSRHRDDMPGYRSSSIQRIIGEVANQRAGFE